MRWKYNFVAIHFSREGNTVNEIARMHETTVTFLLPLLGWVNLTSKVNSYRKKHVSVCVGKYLDTITFATHVFLHIR